MYEQYDPADTVLDTNIAAAGNPPIHATLTIPIAGYYFDRYMGGKFYQDTTVPGVELVEAFDVEREQRPAPRVEDVRGSAQLRPALVSVRGR